MLTSPRLAVLSALFTSQATSASAATAKERTDFMNAMRSSLHNQGKADFKPDAATSAAIREKIIQKATYIPPSRSAPDEDSPNRNLSEERRLSDDDSYTDYYAKSGTFSNAFGFDPTRFSISYSRCAQVRQFDDQLAAIENSTSVFTTKHFAIFRFCPTKTCDPYAIETQATDDDAQQQNQKLYMNMDFSTYQTFRQSKYSQYSNENQQNKQGGEASATEDQTQFQVGGAAGSGCSSNYGEYMIELEDYLEIMSGYVDNRFGEYCTYCEKCMYNEYKNWAQKQGRTLLDQSDEGWRSLKFERELGGCAEYNQCRYYANACKNGLDSDVTSYFQCTSSSSGDVYLGPHCADDGVTITLGAYTDKYCNEYAGDLYTLTGETVDREAIDIYSTGNLNALMPQGYQEQVFNMYGGWETMCIPCSEADASLWNQVDDATSVNELCLYLYESSARCDHNYNNYQTKSKSIGLYDKQRMQLSCDFIDSVKMGKYDEAGFLTLAESPLVKAGFLQNTQYYDAAYPYISKVSGWQIFGLLASLLACLALGIWSIKLHRSLTKKGQWRPRRMNRNSTLNQPVVMNRPDSGIGMARQQTGASYYMS
ncbi:hypothetical protein ACHAWX_007713 [Stephanocyclus meneghinianus]